MDWIDVKDRLPLNDDYVLVYFSSSDEIWLGYYYKNRWNIDEYGETNDVGYWMELPKKPKH